MTSLNGKLSLWPMGKIKSNKNQHTAWIFLRNLLGIYNTVALTVQVLSISNISMLFSGNKMGGLWWLCVWKFWRYFFFWLPLLRMATSHTAPLRYMPCFGFQHITPFFGSSLVLQQRCQHGWEFYGRLSHTSVITCANKGPVPTFKIFPLGTGQFNMSTQTLRSGKALPRRRLGGKIKNYIESCMLYFLLIFCE